MVSTPLACYFILSCTMPLCSHCVVEMRHKRGVHGGRPINIRGGSRSGISAELSIVLQRASMRRPMCISIQYMLVFASFMVHGRACWPDRIIWIVVSSTGAVSRGTCVFDAPSRCTKICTKKDFCESPPRRVPAQYSPHTDMCHACVMSVATSSRAARGPYELGILQVLVFVALPRDLLTTHDSHLASQYVFRGEGQLEAAAA